MTEGAERLSSRGRIESMIEEVFGIDVRSLALYRIGFASLILLDLLGRTADLRAHYTDWGVLPRETVLQGGGLRFLSVHLLNGSTAFEAALFGIAGLFALLLLLGYRTRVSAVVTWILLVSLQSRNNLINHGGDVLLRCLGFWNLFLPLGAAWSVDRLLDRNETRVPQRVVSISTAAALIQVVFMYWFGAMQKTGPMWRDGTALFYALHLDGFATSLGIQAREFPNVLQVLTHCTLQLEMFGPFLAFVPVATGPIRCVVIAAFVMLHLGMGQLMFLGLFPYVCIVAWILFVPSWLWNRLASLGPWSRLERLERWCERVLERARASPRLEPWLRERRLRVAVPIWAQPVAGACSSLCTFGI